MLQFYPFSGKRIVNNWLFMVHSVVRECLNELLADNVVQKKVSADDLDILVPMLERGRVSVLAKQQCQHLKPLF
jgi:hypothetical protein